MTLSFFVVPLHARACAWEGRELRIEEKGSIKKRKREEKGGKKMMIRPVTKKREEVGGKSIGLTILVSFILLLFGLGFPIKSRWTALYKTMTTTTTTTGNPPIDALSNGGVLYTTRKDILRKKQKKIFNELRTAHLRQSINYSERRSRRDVTWRPHPKSSS